MSPAHETALRTALEDLLLHTLHTTCTHGEQAQNLARIFTRLAQETAHTLTVQLIVADKLPPLLHSDHA